MFGHQDDQSKSEATDAIPDEPTNGTAASDDANDQPSGQPVKLPSADDIVQPDSAGSPTVPANTPDPTDASITAENQNNPAWQHPGAPLGDNKEQVPIADVVSPAGGFPKRPSYQYVAGAGAPTDNSDVLGANDSAIHELIDIKQKALDELAPLIDQLDLPPEEKFRAIMMVIQASDDQDLVKAAYAAAHSIEDTKIRGQALLDIVNEVNYFTSPHEDQPSAIS